jgi:hypothetical protein
VRYGVYVAQVCGVYVTQVCGVYVTQVCGVCVTQVCDVRDTGVRCIHTEKRDESDTIFAPPQFKDSAQLTTYASHRGHT